VGPFADLVAAPGTAEALRERLEQFALAMLCGGSREEYLNWQSSRDSLAAALEIVGDPAARGAQAPLEKVGTKER
jgi:hypothetical protein